MPQNPWNPGTFLPKDGAGGSNRLRAARARTLLDHYARLRGDRPDEPSLLPDLLADLAHWCHRDGADFDVELETAREYYLAEGFGAGPMAWPDEARYLAEENAGAGP